MEEYEMEIGICMAVILLLLLLYWCFGRVICLLTGGKLSWRMCLLTGVFVYHGLFQIEALPLMLLKQPLSSLTMLWGVTVAAVLVCLLILEKRAAKQRTDIPRKRKKPLLLYGVMIAAAAVQMYYIITNNYLGWDTAAYVGTIGNSVSRNNMYLYDGLSGRIQNSLDFRYMLSSFYMHSAVWCQILPVKIIYYAKIVQGGLLAVLANLVIFEIGYFLFSGKRYQEKLTETQILACSAAMVIAAIFLNFYYQSIYTTSDFLLNRALEAKGYCANLILPFLFLLCLMVWRDSTKREVKVMLFAGAFGSVAISMSALITAPALITLMLLPVIFREKNWKFAGFYILCMLPDTLYLILYLLYKMKIFRIGI
ncbi:MAG: DUF6077 domain-containing protein [Eubacteriales bacterium]|nr:DUF6077 domain-containing protein [Eubacteriales bacterium]